MLLNIALVSITKEVTLRTWHRCLPPFGSRSQALPRAGRRGGLVLALASIASILPLAPQDSHAKDAIYRGMCDASAAVALGADHFVVADDEHNTLLVYRRGKQAPVGSVPLSKFLGTREDKESDLEGAAELDGRVYWIASHGRNSKGKEREERHRLFATERVPGSKPPTLRTVGAPYVHLLDDLTTAETLKAFSLVAASQRAAEAPEGLNIEGLAATPDHRLLIGFRNPIPGGRALIVPLENPDEVVMNGARARLGAASQLDLGGRGIRSIERVGDIYLIVAGPPADAGTFALYRWSGKAGEAAAPMPGTALGTLRPEALFAVPNTRRIQILSDDGGIETNGVACKDRLAIERSFRSITIELPP